MTDTKVTLITGANRGIGRAIAERYAASGYHVIIGARDSAQADLVAEDIHNTGGSAEGLQIDVADAISIAAAAKAIASRHQTLDVLVNNAGINISVEDDILAAKQADIDISMRTNAYGPLELTKAVLPLLKAASAARIVNVSGQLGSISETVNPDSPLSVVDAASYRLSKTMLNAITGLVAKSLRDDGIKVNAMDPGWTKTDMGGEYAPNTPQQAAELAFQLGTLDEDGVTGGFHSKDGPVAW